MTHSLKKNIGLYYKTFNRGIKYYSIKIDRIWNCKLQNFYNICIQGLSPPALWDYILATYFALSWTNIHACNTAIWITAEVKIYSRDLIVVFHLALYNYLSDNLHNDVWKAQKNFKHLLNFLPLLESIVKMVPPHSAYDIQHSNK